MKNYTVNQLSSCIRDDLGWRRKEIHVHAQTVQRAGPHEKQALLRGAVAVLYAHWEGFIKFACQEYLKFVRCRKLKHAELPDCFLAMAAKKQLNVLSSSNRPRDHIEFIRWWRTEMDRRSHLPGPHVVKSLSNLTFPVFDDMLTQLGLPLRDEYKVASHPVIERLVALRNALAHGDWQCIEQDEWSSQLRPKIEAMMDFVCFDIEAAALGNQFRMVAPPINVGS